MLYGKTKYHLTFIENRGDLYANETRMKIRKIDMALDKLRIACGAKALYRNTVK